MAAKIAYDAKLADIVPHLHDPTAYLLWVKARLAQCRKLHGNAFVRIGRRGSGLYPCFRIHYLENGVERHFGSCIDSGKPFTGAEERSTAWSTHATSIDDLRDLLGFSQDSYRT